MRKLILGFGLLTALLMPLQSVIAQGAATPEQLLAAAILNSDADTANDVTDPASITNAGAVIAAAPPAAVQSAVAAVSGNNPDVAAQVAAAAAGNNSGVSVSAAAEAAGVSTADVFQSAATNVQRSLSASLAGASAGGGGPSAEDIEAAILENPGLIGDILPGLSDRDVETLIRVIETGRTIAQSGIS